jgi:ATP-binding cassette subfamily D (ALD) protein 3
VCELTPAARSHLYSDLAKPIVDIVLFAAKLGQALGVGAPFYMVGYFVLSGSILRAISPPFGKYTAQEQKLEVRPAPAAAWRRRAGAQAARARAGRLPLSPLAPDHARRGDRVLRRPGAREAAGQPLVPGTPSPPPRPPPPPRGAPRPAPDPRSQSIYKHVSRVFQLRFANNVIDSILVKYCATMTAYFLLSRPVFEPGHATDHMGLSARASLRRSPFGWLRARRRPVCGPHADHRGLLAQLGLPRQAVPGGRLADDGGADAGTVCWLHQPSL